MPRTLSLSVKSPTAKPCAPKGTWLAGRGTNLKKKKRKKKRRRKRKERKRKRGKRRKDFECYFLPTLHLIQNYWARKLAHFGVLARNQVRYIIEFYNQVLCLALDVHMYEDVFWIYEFWRPPSLVPENQVCQQVCGSKTRSLLWKKDWSHRSIASRCQVLLALSQLDT